MGSSARQIARNSLVPIAAQVVNKAADFLFAVYTLRLLGSEGNGRYAFAVVTWLLLKTISDFGLGVLATREIAVRPTEAGRWLGGGTTARLIVLAGLLPLVGLGLVGFLASGGLADETALAVLLLTLSIVPGAVSDAATAVFNGRERMVTPALVTVLTTGVKIVVAGGALALGWGVVGLAGASLVVNGITAVILWRLVRPLVEEVHWWPGRSAMQGWLMSAWPLLLNNLLINLYFRLDTYILQSARGEVAVGLYDAAYKFINLTLIIPPYLTLALFPRLARQAEQDVTALRQTLRQAISYLVILALPAVIATTVLADWLIWLVGGAAFLPGAADALRVLIWFLPMSYANGILQYALIALGRQRAITIAFGATVAFNLAANLVMIPMYGTQGAALVTVASELVLLAPLLRLSRAAIGDLGLIGLLWRPVAAMVAMRLVVDATLGLGEWAAVALGGLVYLATLAVLGVWGEDERRLARALIGRRAGSAR